MLTQRSIQLLLLTSLVALGTACGNPCADLAHQICKCKPTQIEQQSCTQQVDNDGRQATPEQQQLCADLQDTCTCSKLAAGDLAACGLSQPDNAETGVAGLLPPVSSAVE